MAFCSKCGKQIPDGQTLCDQCAAEQNSGNSSPQAGREETDRFDAGVNPKFCVTAVFG